MERILKVGHSPDSDDAFMFYALAKEIVRVEGFRLQHVVEDIRTLNQKALKSELEITSVSAAVYPTIAGNYWILSSGASVGRNYGPVVVAKQPYSLEQLIGKRIAVPGRDTTAFLLLSLYAGQFDSIPVPFQDVVRTVQEGKADAGLVIHEGQLNFSDYGLLKCIDLGEYWHEKYRLPIPLSLNVVRKDLGYETAQKVKKALCDSIVYSMEHETEALDYASRFGRGMSGESLKRFVEMYVNKDAVHLGEDGKKALEILFEESAKKGFCKPIQKIEII